MAEEDSGAIVNSHRQAFVLTAEERVAGTYLTRVKDW